MRRPTIHDVAQRAGVSVTTVSMVLRRQEGYKYRPATEDRVRAAAKELGYQPHTAARMLRQQQSSLIGIGIAGSRFVIELTELVHAVHHELVARGYQPLVVDTGVVRTDPGRPWFPGPEVLAGLISIDLTLEEHSPDAYTVGWRRLPMVSLNPTLDLTVDCVTTDRARAMEIAVEHLHTLGHHRIAFFGIRGTYPTNSEKVRGYQQAVRKWKLDNDPALMLLYGSEPGAPEKDRAITFCESIIKMAPRPTAIVCASDNDAMRIMRNLLAAGIKVPDEISITGFGGVQYSAYCFPELTTVAHDRSQIARVAVERVISQIDLATQPAPLDPADAPPIPTSDEPYNVLIKPILQIRGSTAPPPSPQSAGSGKTPNKRP